MNIRHLGERRTLQIGEPSQPSSDAYLPRPSPPQQSRLLSAHTSKHACMPVINTQPKQKWVAVTVFYFYSGQQGGMVQEVMMVVLWGTKSKCEGRFFC